MRLTQRLKAVAPSATLTLAQKAKEMAAAGQDVVNLTAGEPDFDAPPHVLEAIHAALRDGHTRYTAVNGVPALREAICRRYSKVARFEPAQVIASTGAKQSIFNALLALVEAGDEVVIVAPFWLSYGDMVRLAGATPVIVPTEEESGFVMRPEALEAAITPRTRVLMLNSPSNPSGAVYTREALMGLAEVLRRHREITIISDEIYDRFVYGGSQFASLLELAPDLVDRILVVNGCSKTYAMTGLRLGWAVGPKPLISAMTKLQGQSTSNACAPIQYGAIAALEGDQSPVDRMIEAFDVRRRFVVGRLRAMPNVKCFDPRGAFYVLPNLSAYVGRTLPDGSTIDDAFAICGHLLHDHGLVVVPGGPFGAPNHIRLSFATDMDTLGKGLDRLAAALGGLR